MLAAISLMSAVFALAKSSCRDEEVVCVFDLDIDTDEFVRESTCTMSSQVCTIDLIRADFPTPGIHF